MEFWLNDKIDMMDVYDSMQLNSGNIVATLHWGKISVSLEVQGDVEVYWNENGDPMEGEFVTQPSAFPRKLKRLIEDGYTPDGKPWATDPRLLISKRNRFELIAKRGNRKCGSDVVAGQEVEGLSPEELFSMLYEYAAEKSGRDY